jgi:hypothetical protein
MLRFGSSEWLVNEQLRFEEISSHIPSSTRLHANLSVELPRSESQEMSAATLRSMRIPKQDAVVSLSFRAPW